MKPTAKSQGNHEAMQDCIDSCLQCHSVCTHTMAHCIEKGGAHASYEHVRLLADCAQICLTSADFMLRGSPEHSKLCGLCAEVCEQCASSCEGLEQDDDMMSSCADTCRACAELCRQMAE